MKLLGPPVCSVLFTWRLDARTHGRTHAVLADELQHSMQRCVKYKIGINIVESYFEHSCTEVFLTIIE